MTERRYTDQEVARLLQRAADLDRDAGGTTLARGLSLTELEEIAGEVGIDPGMLRRAAGELTTPAPSRVVDALLGGSPVVRRTAAVPARLGSEELGRLVEVVDAEVPAQGTVGEALGTVRWTSSTRFLSRQVVLQPGESETVVRVEERFSGRTRGLVHILPTAYAAGIGLAMGTEVFAAAPAGIALAAAAGLAGLGLGRAIWNALRGRSRRRVEALADRLSEEASLLAPHGSLPTPDEGA